jgi:HK97 family phage major capsid protein
VEATLARQIKERLDAKTEEAKAAWADFDGARKELLSSGKNAADEPDQFKGLHEKHGVYMKVADEAAELQKKLMQALDMEGASQPSSVADLIGGGKREDQDGSKAVSPGDRVAASDAYKALLESGVLERKSGAMPQVQMAAVEALGREELKTLITGLSRTSGGAFIVPDRQPGLVPLAFRPLVVRNLVTVGDTNADIVEWVKENSFTNAAAETAEATSTATGGTKPESGIDYAVVQSTVKTIAHWIPATKRSLSDVGQLRTLIDQRLQDGINLRLDSQMVNGDATGENLRGILNTSGVLTQARGADSGMDAVLKAITNLRLQFVEPTALLMNPTDAQNLRLAKNAQGDYFFGPPMLQGQLQLWGLPIVQSPVVAAGTAVVGKWDEAILWVREGINISATDSHQDFFIRNMVAVLTEGRFAFAIPRPFAFSTVTGL